MISDFKPRYALVGRRQPFVQTAIFLAQRLSFACLLRKPRFEIDDLRAPGGNVDGNLGLCGFKRSQQVLRRGELLAQRLTFFLRKDAFFSSSATSLRSLP